MLGPLLLALCVPSIFADDIGHLENRLGFFKDPSCFFLSVFTFDFIVIFYF
jgi:hypothetical protein